MASASQPPKGGDGLLSPLDGSIQFLNLAKDTCGIPPARVVFSSASAVLTMIRDTTANNQDYVELGRACADVCQVLDRRLKRRQLDELNQPIIDAVGDLTKTVAGIQRRVAKQGRRNAVSRFLLANSDKDKISVWKQDLARVLHIFNTELSISTHMMVVDTHVMVADMHRSASTGLEGTQNHSTQASAPLGEFPPPAPRVCLGRDELVEKIVRLAESLEPIALIGPGGVGKTSIALTALHHRRMKEKFGENRRFIRCDQFPASRTHFLTRLSKIIGAGVENPEDLTPLRPFLSSKEIFIIIDNAESILDPQTTGAREIYAVVDELCQFKTICLCITSRITTVPRYCERPEIPTLSMEAACNIFYGIYRNRGQSSIINDLLRRLDFHALSITLLATTASHNGWDYDRLAQEWVTQRAQVLQADYNESLATTIELSLASPTFLSLGPEARDLLAVVAFFPQGIDEKSLDWLFPTISNIMNVFDKFCVLSLTYRSNGFFTMLAPIRDYLSPRDPQLSPLLCATRDHYFRRLSVNVDPGMPGFGEARWIVFEDANVEHLLDVFTSIDPGKGDTWVACFHFMRHLYWYKPRKTMLRSRIEALPDDHHSKSNCLFELSQLFGQVGNYAERKPLLTHTLELERRLGNDFWVAQTLRQLANVNRLLGLYKEGIQQVKEALGIFEQIGDTEGQTHCLKDLAFLLVEDKQLDAAENAASHAIDLVTGRGQEFLVCQLHRVLGRICGSKGDKKKAIYHLEKALGIASPPNWHKELFWIHYSLARLFCNEDELGDANTHVGRAKLHAIDDPYNLGCAVHMQANVLYLQGGLEDAKSEASRALEIFEKLGAVKEVEICRDLLQMVIRATKNRSTGFRA